MKKLGWIQICSKRYGGNIYGRKAREILSKYFDLELKSIKTKNLGFRYLKPLERFWGLITLKGEKDLWIRDDFFSLTTLGRTRGKSLMVIYHIDSSVFPLPDKLGHFLIEKVFYRNLKKTDVILTISEYWKNYFLKRGYSNVYKIYCGFNLPDFEISQEEVEEFKRKFGLEEKPIIYIGNCQKAKGVVEVYKALKDLDVYLVTSGEEQVKIPAKNLDLEQRDYLRLLKASSLIITMSKFKEGWCMTAHEAMLLNRPVVGSGLGGMKELLEEGGQIICNDFDSLKEKVVYLLNHPETRKKMGQQGYSFAKKFTLEKFNQNWLFLIKKILNQ